MLINANTVLVGDKVSLVPYKPHHVPKYHAWMTSTELQELTESEPLRYDDVSARCPAQPWTQALEFPACGVRVLGRPNPTK